MAQYTIQDTQQVNAHFTFDADSSPAAVEKWIQSKNALDQHSEWEILIWAGTFKDRDERERDREIRVAQIEMHPGGRIWLQWANLSGQP